jgi:hypothetical protein
MAHLSRVYLVMVPHGYAGLEGTDTLCLAILQCEGNRRWLEPKYFTPVLKPIGRVKTIIPPAPDHPDALLDALIAFLPEHFRPCPSFAAIARRLARATTLDFDFCTPKALADWPRLRAEARPLMASLHIWRGDLRDLTCDPDPAP